MDGAPRSPDGLTLAAFAAAVTLGAGNFIGVRFSNRELEPFWGAGLRFAIATTIFVGLMAAMRLRGPRGRDLVLTILFGALGFGAFYALMYWALVRVSAGIASVVMAVVPLLTVLFAWAQGQERLSLRSAAGALLALGGILWMVIGPRDVSLPGTALAAMLLAAACVAQSVILGKRVSHQHPVVTNAIGLGTGTVILLGLSPLAGEAWTLPRQAEVVVAVGYLATAGSIGLFVLLLVVVRRWTASATSYMFVLFPVMTMLLDAVLLDEPITAQGVVGAVLVMAGVWFGALSPGARRALAAAPEAAAA
ncbi:MAG TPA: DMT family transporter [Acidimicrobiia bacterium]|nr:DMT family transporter [Acidimicrobiia bacterium]